jgi:hypothetical protein
MKKRKILLALLCLCFLLPLCLSGCSGHSYDTDWIIGKTSAEIEEKYGAFETTFSYEPSEDGLYKNAQCGYYYLDHIDLLGNDSNEMIFVIRFNKDGVAESCYERYRNIGG